MPNSRNLKYVQAAHLKGDGISFSGLKVEDETNHQLGAVDGAIVDPLSRRLRYFVVDAGRAGRYLMPLDTTCLDPRTRSLRLLAEPDPDSWEEFDPNEFDDFGDDDLIGAMFRPRLHSAA